MRRIPREARLLRRPVRSPGDPPGRQQKPIATFVQYEDLHSIARNQLLNLYDVTLRRRGIPGHRPLQHWRKLDPRPPDKNLVREPTRRPADPDGRPNLIAPHRTTNSSTTSPTNESPATVHSQRTHTPTQGTHTPTQGTHTPTNPTQCQLSPTPIVPHTIRAKDTHLRQSYTMSDFCHGAIPQVARGCADHAAGTRRPRYPWAREIDQRCVSWSPSRRA